MRYLLKYKYLEHICAHQYEELMRTFSDCEKTEEGILINYTDKNYKCMPILEAVRDSKIQAISLFSGGGGLDIGTQMAGCKIISTLDFELATLKTIKANRFFSHAEHFCEDVRNIDASFYSSIIRHNNPDKLILVGGPPCQPFSKAGYWITNEKRKGVNDDRNMVGEYLRIIKDIRPDGFLLENVESILHPTNKSIVDFIVETILQMGYHFIMVKANALEYGVPQKRKRVFFLASRNPINDNINKPYNPSINVLDWIGRFDIDSLEEAGETTQGKTYDYELSEIPPGHNYIALSARDNYPNPKFVANKRFWNFLLKLHPLLPSWTIAAQPGPWVGPFHWNNRRLRMCEVAAIQTFPIDYKFIGPRRVVQKQIGNAVPCILGQQMVEHLMKYL